MGELTRAVPALHEPSRELDYSQVATVSNPPTMYRAKTRSNGAWYFSSTDPAQPEKQSGRFDLPVPRGTCYWADDAEAAVRERLGPNLTAAPGRVPQFLLDTAEVVSADGADGEFVDLADVSNVVRFGITGELSTTPDYPLAQRYAATFDLAGHSGIRYRGRFSGDGPTNAAAVFGDAGSDLARPVDGGSVDAVAVAVGMGLTVVPSPAASLASAMTIIDDSVEPRAVR